ncbi:MAG: hypothetical protein ACFNO7_03675, partial [Bacteroides sp.]
PISGTQESIAHTKASLRTALIGRSAGVYAHSDYFTVCCVGRGVPRPYSRAAGANPQCDPIFRTESATHCPQWFNYVLTIPTRAPFVFFTQE